MAFSYSSGATIELTAEAISAALQRVSADIKRQAGPILKRHALMAKESVQSNYPEGPTGNLRLRVGYKDYSPELRHAVWAYAPHVHFYEEGTAERKDATRGGASRGRMPKRGPIFIPVMVANRTRAYQDLQDLVDRDREL